MKIIKFHEIKQEIKNTAEDFKDFYENILKTNYNTHQPIL